MKGSLMRHWIPAASKILRRDQVKISCITQGCTQSCKQLFAIVRKWWKLYIHYITHARLPCSQSLSTLASCGWFLRWCSSAVGNECCSNSLKSTTVQSLRYGALHTVMVFFTHKRDNSQHDTDIAYTTMPTSVAYQAPSRMLVSKLTACIA